MCHLDRCEFAPEPTAAGRARQFVRDRCRAWGIEDLSDLATLLTSELVTNGVLHARTTIRVEMTVAEGRLRIAVLDNDLRAPVMRDVRSDLMADIDEVLRRDESGTETDERHAVMNVGAAGSIGAGRGLLLVDAMADEWGVESHAAGKSVWFDIRIPHAQPGRPDRCDCGLELAV